mmetsp:Transcript_19296/g.31586  ORF Transcript_19296/g.31586 Transcript_19296/m.31586 type:complete len:405 (-) Transcript_19296:11-1225(-)
MVQRIVKSIAIVGTAAIVISLWTFTVDALKRRKRIILVERASGLIKGTSIGDAKGLPYVGLSSDQISDFENSTRNNNGVMGLYLRVPSTNAEYPSDWATGRWSEVAQLCMAVGRAISSMTAYGQVGPLRETGMLLIAAEHIRELERCNYGWDNATREAVCRLRDRGARSFRTSGSKGANSNRVLCKLAPLALHYVCLGERGVSADDRMADVETLTRMTHDSTAAVITAQVWFDVLRWLFTQPSPSTFLSPAANRRMLLIHALHTAGRLERLHRWDELADSLKGPSSLSSRCKELLMSFSEHAPLTISDIDVLRISCGASELCIDTLTLVIGVLIQRPLSFESILHTVKLGGSANATAAMVGSVVGCMLGVKGIDHMHVTELYRYDEVRSVGRTFGAVCASYRRL